jgi:hypothetical protein
MRRNVWRNRDGGGVRQVKFHPSVPPPCGRHIVSTISPQLKAHLSSSLSAPEAIMRRPRPSRSAIVLIFGVLCAISLLGLGGCVVAPVGGYYGGPAVYVPAPYYQGGYYHGGGGRYYGR